MKKKSIQRLFLVPAILCMLLATGLMLHSGKAQAASPSLIQVTAQNWQQYIHQSTSYTTASHSAAPTYIVGNPFIFSAYLQSSNGYYVSEEQNYTGSSQYMLRARTIGPPSNVLGTWERFHFYNTGGLWFIQSNNGNFVAEEQNYTGSSQYMLRARTASNCCGTWEAFFLYAVPYTNTFIIKSSNGYYVSEEQNYTGSNQYMLRARTSSSNCCGEWERFNIIEFMD